MRLRQSNAIPIIGGVLVSDFHFELPEELIAQEPLADRAGSRLLHLVSGAESACQRDDRQFREFPELLRPRDLVVFNNTRVFPARLYGRRGGVRQWEIKIAVSSRKKREKVGHPRGSFIRAALRCC